MQTHPTDVAQYFRLCNQEISFFEKGAFKSINQDPIAEIFIDKKGARIEMNETQIHDARIESESPIFFDESIKIAEFSSWPTFAFGFDSSSY